MPQQTNLNVAPYFDDFDARNDYHRVLFKPGYPVQARELTTLQSILQNQIEKFGQHFFKEGSKVIPGNTSYNTQYYCVQLQNTYQGVPVAAYVEQLVGSKITGQTSGVSAVVDKVLLPQDSERGNLTLYINYLNSNTQNNSTEQFSDGESLISNITISSGLLGNSIISSGQPFAITIPSNASAVGSSFSISNGVYFVRGQFVNVETETLILDQYDNRSTYRVGLFVNEQIINSDIDESLNDNSQGFNNYASPGADRLKISVSLFKKPISDYNDNNFVELGTIEEGILRTKVKETDYSFITDELARRTYDESGDYYVRPFNVSIKESLNNKLGNGGIFNENQFTYGGLSPSENLAVYQISPGKAIVRGYEVETISPTFLDVEKPRSTKTLENQSINYNTGSTLSLNSVYGFPTIGVGNTYILSLRDERVGESSITAPGKEIGVARVYDFKLESGSYDSINQNLNQWDISLYDVQTITEITLNEPITLSVPTFVQGSNSGSVGFIKDEVFESNLITLYDTKGTFLRNESFIFDGIQSGYVAVAVTSYGISDVKSVYGSVGTSSTFSANVLQYPYYPIGISVISPESSGISTVTIPDLTVSSSGLKNIIKNGDILSYTDTTVSEPIYVKIIDINLPEIIVSGITTVSGISNGKLPLTETQVFDLKILKSKLSSSSDNSLYTTLPKSNISSIDLKNGNLSIRKTFLVNISSNKLSIPVSADTDETFLPFDGERYSLIRSDGSTETLTSDMFEFIDGGKQLQINNLSSDDIGAKLTSTLRKVNPKSKVKRKNRVNSILVDKSKNASSGIGQSTLNDGLIYGNYAYGTRVQDKIISLGFPDIIDVYGIFESADTSDPYSPTITLSSINGPSGTTSDFTVGEQIVGQNGDAIAIVAEKLTGTQISFIYQNENIFREGETIVSKESNIQAVITSIDSSSFNISNNYSFSSGQNNSFYDYGIITRQDNSQEPSKKIKIYFSNGFYDPSDDGDITTVNSYSNFDYASEIPAIGNISCSDIIDIRPRVSPYVFREDQRSPLEFYGRVFSSSENSSKNILESKNSILSTFSFYLGRIDRIYVSKDGKFQVKYGIPSENPEKPDLIDDSLEIATINLPPYLYSTSQASITFLEHKRYRMSDIKNLENRIKNLEYYTSLSLLETNTSNLFIPDESGLNRFKSGFFVDNFSSKLSQDTNIEIKNSIDKVNKELRPKHYTNSIDLVVGPLQTINSNEDLQFSPIEGIDVRKTGDIITLDYVEVSWLQQVFATRSESVTPFIVSFWQGVLELTPSSDTWVDNVRIEPRVIQQIEGNFDQTVRDLNIDPQTGFGPTTWNSWTQDWTGEEIQTPTSTSTTTNLAVRARRGRIITLPDRSVGGFTIVGRGRRVRRTNTTTTQNSIQTGTETRTGTRTIVSEQFDQIPIGDRVVSRELITFMRSRNIQFSINRLKPLTQLYAFFDGIDITRYCVPKLLEINMISGVFEVGETVVGSISDTGLGPDTNSDSIPRITFRVSQLNHKYGPYNAPTSTFRDDPYTQRILPSTYSSTSTILNVDTFSLSNEPQGEFSGWVQSGMILVGSTSGAQAVITDVRLISDISSVLIGSLYIPDPNVDVHPKFETGSKLLSFTNDNSNSPQISPTTVAEEIFSSVGTLETIQNDVISIRNARIGEEDVSETRPVQRTTNSQVTSTNSVTRVSRLSRARRRWVDPLAQSFLVDEDTGIFLTRCDLFFESKDDTDIPVSVEIRTMSNGYPTQDIIPLSEVILSPSEVLTSSDASIATPVTFKSPVYLEGGKEYCICILSNSTKYRVFVSRVGENDLSTDAFISNQPYLGSLFKSQNASTWESSQWEDLKFSLYRADFIDSGNFQLYNPDLTEGNKMIAKLMPNSLAFSSKKIKVGLASTLNDIDLTIGNTILQEGTDAFGNYVGNSGIATGNLNIINSGIGYTPSSGSFTFSDVSLIPITGEGKNATASITISNGVAIAATINSGGSGYQIGDVLAIESIGLTNAGRNARFSLPSISSINEIIIDNVQGDFVVGSANTIKYVNNLGITTYLNGTGVVPQEIIVKNDGLHIKVEHKNHGMLSENNLVKIYNVQSDINPTRLSSPLSADSITVISVDDSNIFSTFENLSVSQENPGYLLIGDEIIQYTSVSSGLIGGNIIRGTSPRNYPAGTPVYKYEINGISLNRINKTHNLSEVLIPDSITFDSYYIKIDNSVGGTDRSPSNSSGYPSLHANQTKSSGGDNIRATQNIPFEIITPMIHNVTVSGTSLSAEIRTVTGKSINGNEIPFTDVGYEPITINLPNYLTSPRCILSKINEVDKLSNLPDNKSLTMRISLETTDSRISPVLDTHRMSAIFTSNKINSPIENYATDYRVNTIDSDPSSFQYISKEIILENPASSIKIILDAHINSYSDIRAFYSIGDSPNFTPIFTPFPGFNNLNTSGQIIDFENSDGSSDKFITTSNTIGFLPSELEYKEYTFTADNLPNFRSYRIKLILTSTNQSYVPRVKNLRAIALA